MSHKRINQLTASDEWAKHLRPLEIPPGTLNSILTQAGLKK